MEAATMKSPAFQFYPNDWISSRSVRLMTAEQKGWYISLICEAWMSEDQGTLPDDSELLKRLVGATGCKENEWQLVINNFVSKNGRLINERLVKEKSKQENFSKHQSESGKAGARKRWGRYGNPIKSPMANHSSSSSSSSSEGKTTKKITSKQLESIARMVRPNGASNSKANENLF